MRRGTNKAGSKIESKNWFGSFIVKEENHPKYNLRLADRRKFGRSVYSSRSIGYVEVQFSDTDTLDWNTLNIPKNFNGYIVSQISKKEEYKNKF